MSDAMLRVDGLTAEIGRIPVLRGVNLHVGAGETVALLGRNGVGKTSLLRAITGAHPISAGTIIWEGQDITRLPPKARRALATEIAIVFQDPTAALDPKMTVADSILEPLAIQGRSTAEQRRRLTELLDRVGLPAAYAARTPNALSGGQKQRVVIARALALSPKLLVLDEPVSALDVSIRSQILNLLMELQQELGLAYLFISHDLSVVRHVADETMVMYLGSVAEQGDTDALFSAARHPYTQALLSAIPLPDPVAQRKRQKIILTGDLPSPLAPPPGCPFASRCPIRTEPCEQVRPVLTASGPGLSTACLVRAPRVEVMGATTA